MFGIGTLSSPHRTASSVTASAAVLSLLIRGGKYVVFPTAALWPGDAVQLHLRGFCVPLRPPPDVPTLWNADDAALAFLLDSASSSCFSM